VPNFVSFVASIAELAHGEKSNTHSITNAAYLMPRKPKRLHFETCFSPVGISPLFTMTSLSCRLITTLVIDTRNIASYVNI